MNDLISVIQVVYRYASLNDGDTFWELRRSRFRRFANVYLHIST